jgi:hypothetical protein
VPICYVYDGGRVDGHAVDGMKRHAMQTNPQVWYEVERVGDHLAQCDRLGVLYVSTPCDHCPAARCLCALTSRGQIDGVLRVPGWVEVATGSR